MLDGHVKESCVVWGKKEVGEDWQRMRWHVKELEKECTDNMTDVILIITVRGVGSDSSIVAAMEVKNQMIAWKVLCHLNGRYMSVSCVKVHNLVFHCCVYCFLTTSFLWRYSDSGGCGIYRVSQEETARLRESVPYVKLYRYNPKHLYPKLNGYGDNGQRKVWSSCGFHVLYLAVSKVISSLIELGIMCHVKCLEP